MSNIEIRTVLDDENDELSKSLQGFISRLLTKVKLDDSLKELVRDIREDRKPNKTCVSAQDGVYVPALLLKTVYTQFFKKDYEDCTLKLLSEPVTYDDAIKALEKIIVSSVFESDDGMGNRKKNELEM